MAKKQYKVPVSGVVAQYARTSLGLSLSDACKQLDIEAEELEAIEAGSEQPEIVLLKSMAKVYKRSLTFMLLAEVPYEKPLPRDHRTAGSVKLEHFHSKTILTVRKARTLAISQIDLLRNLNLPVPAFKYRSTLQDDPRALGQKLRQQLELYHLREEGITDAQALEHTIDAVSALGVLVYQLSLTQDGLRGFSVLDEEVPIIVLKRGGEMPTARLFTLFHELGHVMLGESGMCDLHAADGEAIEQWCNSFAAEVLLPREELRQHEVVVQHLAANVGKEWARVELANIAKEYHVGLEVVLRALHSEKLTTPEFYEEHHLKWKEKAFGRAKKGQPRDTIKGKVQERGRSFVRLIFNAFDRERIGAIQASQLLDVPMDRFSHARQLVA
ncbi:MAG TPA: ImmA/IrrE family metallo-endopeptidase [Flavobacteriales bacterium]|nr:ImmA/IrrE family metallo-endopeptidase [Flavobacteriales bacterium]